MSISVKDCYDPTMDETKITRIEAAARARVNVRTLDYWRRTGRLKSHTDGRGKVWVEVEELDRFLTPVPVTVH